MLLRYRYRLASTNEISYVESFTPPITDIKPNSLTIVGKLENNTVNTISVDVDLLSNTEAFIGPLSIGSYTIKVNKKIPLDGAPTALFHVAKYDMSSPAQINDMLNLTSSDDQILTLNWLGGELLLRLRKYKIPSSSMYDGIYSVVIS